jgi:DNA-binding MarR family transcriptional regulator
MTPGTSSQNPVETGALAGDLRIAIGQMFRRLRSEQDGFTLSQGAVLGRLVREGSQSVSDLAAAERVRPQSMAQTVADLESAGLVDRSPDPDDGRRALVDLTEAGMEAILVSRRIREGWLAEEIEKLAPADRVALARAVEILGDFADGDSR